MFLITGCSSQDRPDTEADAAAINAIWSTYESSLEADDIDAWLSLWTENGVQMPPNEAPVVGKDQLRERNGAALQQFTFEMDITNEEVVVVEDLAYSRGVYTAMLTPKDGGQSIPVDGKFMTILHRQPDGGWKIHRDIFNSNVALGGQYTRAADEQAIRAAEIEAVHAFNEGNLDGYMASYPEDSAWLPPNAPIVNGAEAIRSLAAQLAANPGFAFAVEVDAVEVSGDGRMAYLVGYYELTLSDSDGNPGTDSGKFVEVWKKHPDASWKHVLAIWNSNSP